MSAIDISRHIFKPEKRYSGLVQFQGSVILESDQNERDLMNGEERRRFVREIMCSRGSPNSGFKITGVAPNAGTYDFTIMAGSMYLGGVRFEAEVDEKHSTQTDWLQLPAGERPAAPALADLAAGSRYDFVWMEGWEQPVTPTEDSECLERGLGGPQTAARLRPMRHIRVKTNTAATCPAAFQALITELTAGGLAMFEPKTAELLSTTRMTVGFAPGGAPADACSPPVANGYLGAENETIQVRILDANRFIWSYGNAAPLHRVQMQMYAPPVGPAERRAVKFLEPPRDQSSRPLVGDVIELKRWDAFLPNGQKAGEAHGRFLEVVEPYDPETDIVIVREQVLPAWSSIAVANALAPTYGVPPEAEYHFACIWRGQGVAATPPGQIFAALPVGLGASGLTVAFTNGGRIGDYWTFSARPHTPNQIVPWDLMLPAGARPTGYRRYITPLAIIEWRVDQGVVTPHVHDCRRRIRALCKASGCCEITVGDGNLSHGDVMTITEALALLPEEGGKICVLKGTYQEHITIDERHNIIIEGCGPLSRIRAAAGNSTPVISIRNSQAISIHTLAIEAPEGLGIAMDDDVPGQFDFGALLRGITLDGLIFTSRDAPAVFFNGGRGFVMSDCTVDFERLAAPLMSDASGKGLASAVLLRGADIRVELCRIGVALEDERRTLIPVGGVHVLGASDDVEIRRNRIFSTNGTGVLLGSVTYRPQGAEENFGWRHAVTVGIEWAQAAQENGSVLYTPAHRAIDDCFGVDPVPPDGPPDGGRPTVPDADPRIVRLRILDNDIEDMGWNGIGVFTFFDLDIIAEMISIKDVEISTNRIIACKWREGPDLQGNFYTQSGYGGIALAHTERLLLRDNVIRNCGPRGHPDQPICGFFCLVAEGAFIERNTIAGNGVRAMSLDTAQKLGRRGGIVIAFAASPTSPVLERERFFQEDIEALRISDNAVVAPEGRALQVLGIGGMQIVDNQLTSQGATSLNWGFQLLSLLFNRGAVGGIGIASATFPPGAQETFAVNPVEVLVGGAVVSVMNLALLGEVNVGGVGIGFFNPEVGEEGAFRSGMTFASGKVMFNDNQVRLDAVTDAITAVFSSIALFSLDDVSMNDNQGDCDLTFDVVLVHAIVVAATLRMADNRLSEPLIPVESPRTLLSGLTLGVMNATLDNQGTHCFLPLGLQPLSQLGPNRAMIDLFGTGERSLCARFQQQGNGFLPSIFSSDIGSYGYVAVDN